MKSRGMMDESDESLTFRLNFSSDGVSMLQHRIKDKLHHFMGDDYTDDTLVEYVIVLLKNGRRKVEAKKDLNVFLGDDSDCFVSWLWDHLGQNLDLYVQASDAFLNEVATTKSTLREQPTEIDTHHMDAEQEREKPKKLSRSRHGRQWKGIAKYAVETPPLRRMVTSNTLVEEDAHMKVDHLKPSLSRPVLQRKRHRSDERIPMKKDEVSKTIINAPRRLLQFAVRDALSSCRMNSLGSEPLSKRMRSLVPVSAGYSSIGDRTQRIQSVARVPNASMAVAIKAVAEAAQDVGEVGSSGNVFSRLGRSMDELDTSEHIAKFIGSPVEAVEENGSFDYLLVENQAAHLHLNDFDECYPKYRTPLESYAGFVSDALSDNEIYESGHLWGHNSMDVSHSDFDERYPKYRTSLESYAGFVSDALSDNEIYESGHLGGPNSMDVSHSDYDERYPKYRTSLESYAGFVSDALSDDEIYESGHLGGRNSMDVSRCGVSVKNKDDDSLMLQYNLAGEADQSTSKPRKDQYQSVAADTSSKIVNISVNVNTWKPSQYQETEVSAVRRQKFVYESGAEDGKSNAQMKENNAPFSVGNANDILAADGQRESQKSLSSTVGSYSAGRLVEDTDSRTIFLSNVHFAATKDSLSQHFNKFGDVLKVIVLTDVITGQPKGSAYVEFMKREAAEHALSLDGTSFLSRILKVVKKSAAPQEAAIVMSRPQIFRGSTFAASRFGRVPFARGIRPYQARPPMKAGARSFQWKRGAQMATVTSSVSANSIPFPITPRSLTYVRGEGKANGNSSAV